jgi:hypothetical protein
MAPLPGVEKKRGHPPAKAGDAKPDSGCALRLQHVCLPDDFQKHPSSEAKNGAMRRQKPETLHCDSALYEATKTAYAYPNSVVSRNPLEREPTPMPLTPPPTDAPRLFTTGTS